MSSLRTRTERPLRLLPNLVKPRRLIMGRKFLSLNWKKGHFFLPLYVRLSLFIICFVSIVYIFSSLVIIVEDELERRGRPFGTKYDARPVLGRGNLFFSTERAYKFRCRNCVIISGCYNPFSCHVLYGFISYVSMCLSFNYCTLCAISGIFSESIIFAGLQRSPATIVGRSGNSIHCPS